MDLTSRPSVRPLEHQLLAFLLRRARQQVGFDLSTAAARWGQPSKRLEAVEAGSDTPDWWDVRGLLDAYGLSFPAFAAEYDRRWAAVCAPPADLPPAVPRNPDVAAATRSSDAS